MTGKSKKLVQNSFDKIGKICHIGKIDHFGISDQLKKTYEGNLSGAKEILYF